MTECNAFQSDLEFSRVFDFYFERLSYWYTKNGCEKLGLDPEQLAINVLFEIYQVYDREVKDPKSCGRVAPEPLASLVWTVARQRLRDMLRTQYRRREKISITNGYLASYMECLQAESQLSDGTVECRDLLEYLQRILCGRSWEVLRLLLERKNYDEISNVLGVSCSTVKRDIARIREVVDFVIN